MIAFRLQPSERRARPALEYRVEDHAFGVDEPNCESLTSVTVNEVELHLAGDGRICCVSGYCPREGWLRTRFSPPASEWADLLVDPPHPIPVGAAMTVNAIDDRWPAHHNLFGWVCIGDPSVRGDRAAEFAPGCIAVLDGVSLRSLWLHPVMR